ncbi:tol-pal system-associated acyl-CoA thioesterase [Halochromatium salexigens]|uniref:Tol-pal system-associated acyl-CoA thioesterase n=1 Tax=Halochromatium salexigens TaxID=49447 RepID=A0AAJ0XHN1_HALSE|nr:tol-pal system-associated acyl-CoA thioesterase [Halochromatium salexigens]MBK5932041.1 tol-pal system-associated acyl-CoA thioesterase [Halochromatium salexigens]
MSPQAPVFEWPVRIYYEDTDAGGVVYHARYLHFLERARTEWLRALGFEQARLRAEQGILFAVRKMSLDFVRPAALDQALRVTLRLTAQRRASIDFEQRILAARDDHVCCRAQVNIACLDADHLRPTRIPEAVLNALAPSTDRGGANGDITHGL